MDNLTLRSGLKAHRHDSMQGATSHCAVRQPFDKTSPSSPRPELGAKAGEALRAVSEVEPRRSNLASYLGYYAD
jgi:hypothetical protein